MEKFYVPSALDHLKILWGTFSLLHHNTWEYLSDSCKKIKIIMFIYFSYLNLSLLFDMLNITVDLGVIC